MSEARLSVVVGGGGVGKTTTAAALALAHARARRRVLVVTVDPARRLADALGVDVGIDAGAATIDGATLYARMPDSTKSVDAFAEWLFQDPAALARVRENGMYRELAGALAGVHELVCVAFVDHELSSGRWDEVVLDTAPSRHALELMDYPGRLARMLEARTLEWISSLARLAGATLDTRPDERGLFAWGKKRVGSLVSHLVGPTAIRDIAALFTEFSLVRERWLELVTRVERRMADPRCRYYVVSAPSGSSLDDAAHLFAELRARRIRPTAALLNRAMHDPPPWLGALEEHGDPRLQEILLSYGREFGARIAATRAAEARLVTHGVPVVPLPALRTSDARRILIQLSATLAASEHGAG